VSGSFCSLTGARTLIDSNLVELNCLNISRMVVQLQDNKLEGVDAAFLPDVLHEAVHHWCFNTPVGVALGILREQLMEAVLSDTTPEELGALYIRYFTALEVLRPLVEGIALFAEFDAIPGDGNLRVVPLIWLAILAYPGSRSNKGNRTIEEAIRSAISRLRRVEATAQRKDNLLCQPLNPQARGGYLAGYMVVKGLWLRTAARSSLAGDAELWLAFLRAWIFHDTELAWELQRPVEPDPPIGDAVSSAERFSDRLNELLNPDTTASALTAFNNAYSPGAAAEDAIRALGLTSSSRERFEHAFGAHIDRMEMPTASESVNIARRLTWSALQTRGWICVASTPGRLRCSENGALKFEATSGPLQIMYPSLAPDSPPRGVPVETGQDHPATYEFWVGPEGRNALFALASAAGAHAYQIVWESDGDEREAFLSCMVSNRDAVIMHDWMRVTVDNSIEPPAFAVTLRSVVEEYLDGALGKQADLAVNLYRGGQVAKQAMWENGLFSVVRDSTLLRIASAMTLIETLGEDESQNIDPELRDTIGTMLATDGARSGILLTDLVTNRILL
jgi:hypothetical protein